MKRLALILALAGVHIAAVPQIRGTLWILGKTPDRNPYNCSTSTSGTRVPSAASITDDLCSVWTQGSGTSPNIQILRNGSLLVAGIQILWYTGVLYVQGNDSNWYSWLPETGFTFYGSTDPQSGGGVPTGYFVATTGDDAKTCMQASNVATPKLTVASAISCLSNGDTLYLRGGTYNMTLNNTAIAGGGSWATAKTIKAYPGETVWWTPSAGDFVVYFHGAQQYVIFDGINMDGSAMVYGTYKIEASQGNNPHHIRWLNAEGIGPTTSINGPQIVTFDQQQSGAIGANEAINLTLHSLGGDDFNHAIYVKSSNDVIDSCNIYDVPGSGVHMFNGSYPITATVVRNNTIHDLRATVSGQRHWGIIASVGATGSQIYNNTVYGVPNNGGSSEGILVLQSGADNLIENNTVTANSGGGINVGNGLSTPVGTVVRNNITWGNTGTDYQNAGTGTIASNNLCSSGCAVSSDPVFVSAAGHNYRLQVSSPAKDTGVTLSSVFTTDADGIPRPQGPAWDIGAYEYH